MPRIKPGLISQWIGIILFSVFVRLNITFFAVLFAKTTKNINDWKILFQG